MSKLKVMKSDLRLTDAQAYYKGANWGELFHDFFFELGEDGLPKWKNIQSFARAHTENKMQFQFMCYFIGPEYYDQELDSRYTFIKPQDWMEKRKTGKWFSSLNTKLATAQIRSKMDAMSAIREAGSSFTVPIMAQFAGLINQVIEAFDGQPFTSPMTADNMARARCFMDLVGQAFSLYRQVCELHAKQYLVNFERMAEFAQVLDAVSKTESKSTEKDEFKLRVVELSKQIQADMDADMVQKGMYYGLPEAIASSKATEAIASDVAHKDSEKKKLQ